MFSPADIAERLSDVGFAKSVMSLSKMFFLAIFAGIFIALAGIASVFTNVYANKFAGACVFTCGLAMVVTAGSELFTGNCLITLAVLERRATVHGMLRNWCVVYFGNLIGAGLVAAIAVYGNVFSNPEVAQALIDTAAAKANLGFGDAFVKGVLCNILVCIAVWMSFGTMTLEGKAILVFLPIMAFVVSGFEHCVANMFYFPAGMLQALKSGAMPEGLTVLRVIFRNLIPATLGNIVGGGVLVGGGYWLIFSHRKYSAP